MVWTLAEDFRPDVLQMQRARRAVALAIQAGVLVRPDRCNRCPAKSVLAHHDDYDQPLKVEWLCHRCHRVEHAGTGSRARMIPLAFEADAKLPQPLEDVAARLGISAGQLRRWARFLGLTSYRMPGQRKRTYLDYDETKRKLAKGRPVG